MQIIDNAGHLIVFMIYSDFEVYIMVFKGTNCHKKDMWERPCLIQLLTCFEVSDCRNFWND